MHTRFATSPDHIRIAYDMSGAGPTLMLLHGGGGSRQEWHERGYVKRLMVGNPLGPGVSGEWRQMAVDFRARWAPLVRAQAGSAPGGAFDPRLLSPADQEEIQRLSFPGELVPVVLAFSSAMLDWGVVTPSDLLCPTLWLFGSENKNAMDSFKEYKESLKGSRVQVYVIEGFTHPQEFDEIEQVLPVVLAFTRS
jgi:pimeloyl-ACP methyl ester carboxylesterase